MREIHLKLLKKFTPTEIEEMRDMCRQGISKEIIARTFNCNPTTVIHWVSDLEEYRNQYVKNID